jgi:hypothetical protein
MRYPDLAIGDTVHLKAAVVGVDYSDARVTFGGRGLHYIFEVPRASISAVDRVPDAKLLAVLCGPAGRIVDDHAVRAPLPASVAA